MKNGLITKKTILILLALVSIVGCASSPTDTKTTLKTLTPTPKHEIAKTLPVNNGMFDGVYHNWKGTPYRYGGSSKKE